MSIVTTSFASLARRCCFVLLVAAIAATSFQGTSSTSIFALAADDEEATGISNRKLIRRPDEEELEDIEEELEALEELVEGLEEEPEVEVAGIEPEEAVLCKDKKFYKINPNKKGKILICDWVKQKPKARCKNLIKKNIVKGKKRKKKKTTKMIDPMVYCGCTCENVHPPSDDTGDDSADDSTDEDEAEEPLDCPADINEAYDLHGIPCQRDGYEAGQMCSYGWTWTGCTYGDLKCEARTLCECGDDFLFPGQDIWVCRDFEHEGHELFHPCPNEPTDPRDPPTDDTEPVPPESGTSCTEGEEPPTQRKTLEVRHGRGIRG
jgi:hypothetical protein